MIYNKKKFQNGIKRILLAFTLAFIGPVLFVLGLGNEKLNTGNLIMIILGSLSMLGCLIIGFIAIRTILNSFFENTNE